MLYVTDLEKQLTERAVSYEPGELSPIPTRGCDFLHSIRPGKLTGFIQSGPSLHNDALSSALRQSGSVQLGILIWHHAVTGDRKVADTDAIQCLAEADYRILLHGDVHEARDHLLNYLDPEQRIHVIGGGTFGALAHDRPESTPPLYSLLEVSRDLSKIRVVRRRQNRPEGPYEAYAIYSGPDENTKKADYTIPISSGASFVTSR